MSPARYLTRAVSLFAGWTCILLAWPAFAVADSVYDPAGVFYRTRWITGAVVSLLVVVAVAAAASLALVRIERTVARQGRNSMPSDAADVDARQ